jgi:hypothetical protein
MWLELPIMKLDTKPRPMRISVALVAAVLGLIVHPSRAAQMEDAPVFEVFELSPSRTRPSELTYDQDSPLLTIKSIRQVKADYEHSTVTVTLKENDTKAFASLTRQFKGRFLLLRGTDRAMEVMRIRGAMQNGQLSFDPVDSAPVFRYLTDRFGLATKQREWTEPLVKPLLTPTQSFMPIGRSSRPLRTHVSWLTLRACVSLHQ